MKIPLNEEPFEHHCDNGITFKAERCDFQGGIVAVLPRGISNERLMADVSQMIGYHAANITPNLNGFSGYGGIKYTIVQA